MSELQPVRLPSPGLRSGAGFLGAFLLGALLVAIIKPWGTGGPVAAGPSPSAAPAHTLPIAASPDIAGFNALDYNPAIFGLHEPEATWAIWPAGYLVTFGFVIQLSGEQGASPGPSLNPGPGSSGPTRSAPPSGGPEPSGAAAGPEWPARFDVPEGNHLFLIGVNTPPGFRLASHQLLLRAEDGTFTTPWPIAEFQSPWPSHFWVLGIRDPLNASDARLIVWPAGDYRLQLGFEPGGISRSIDIHIAPPVAASASPGASSPPPLASPAASLP
jgi:hypothetical protein